MNNTFRCIVLQFVAMMTLGWISHWLMMSTGGAFAGLYRGMLTNHNVSKSARQNRIACTFNTVLTTYVRNGAVVHATSAYRCREAGPFRWGGGVWSLADCITWGNLVVQFSLRIVTTAQYSTCPQSLWGYVLHIPWTQGHGGHARVDTGKFGHAKISDFSTIPCNHKHIISCEVSV